MDLTAHADTFADLENAADDAIGAAHDELVSRLEELRARKDDRTLTDDELTELQNDVVPNLQTVRAERANREQRRSEQYQGLDSAFAEFDEPGEQDEEPEAAEDTAEQAEGDETTEGDEATTPEQVAVAASANKGKRKTTVPKIGTTGRHVDNGAPTATDGRVPIAITAAGDLGDYSAGQRVTFDAAGEMVAQKLHSLRNIGGGNGEQVPILRLRGEMPEARRLRRNGYEDQNTRRLNDVTAPKALTAAGLCAPLAIDYSYETIGSTGRPIRDSLPGFQADRGGIMFRPDISPVTDTTSPSAFDATDHWSMADDKAVTGDPETEPKTKGLWVVGCPDTQTAEVEAITLQIEYSNVSARFDPETLQSHQQAALVAHDRHCENWLLQKLQSLSKAVTSAQVLGATRDLLVTLDRTQAYYRSVHRIPNNVALRAILPFWAIHLIRADMARSMALSPTETLALSDETVNGFLRTRGLSPVWHLDGKATNTAASAPLPAVEAQQYTMVANGAAVPGFPATVDFLLHAEGHFTHLDGGTLDLGVIRDSRLVATNRYRTFSETWEGVAPRGVEALRVLAKCSPTGETAGAIDVSASA